MALTACWRWPTDHNAIKGRVEPEVLDPPVERDCSRLICIYGLRGAKDPELDLAGPETFLELGRFKRHYESVAEGMPRFTAAATWTAAPLETSRGTVGSLRGAEARLGIVKYSGSALVLWLDIEVDLTEAIVLLQETCFRYETLRIDGVRPLDAVRKAQPGVAAAFEKAEFDQEIHQIFAPSSALTAALRAGKEASLAPNPDPLLRLVYREDRDFRTEGSAMRYPKELHRPSRASARTDGALRSRRGSAPRRDGVILTAFELARSAGCLVECAPTQWRLSRARLERRHPRTRLCRLCSSQGSCAGSRPT